MKYIVADIIEGKRRIFRVVNRFNTKVGTLAIFHDHFYSGDERYFSSADAQGIALNPMQVNTYLAVVNAFMLYAVVTRSCLNHQNIHLLKLRS